MQLSCLCCYWRNWLIVQKCSSFRLLEFMSVDVIGSTWLFWYNRNLVNRFDALVLHLSLWFSAIGQSYRQLLAGHLLSAMLRYIWLVAFPSTIDYYGRQGQKFWVSKSLALKEWSIPQQCLCVKTDSRFRKICQASWAVLSQWISVLFMNGSFRIFKWSAAPLIASWADRCRCGRIYSAMGGLPAQ